MGPSSFYCRVFWTLVSALLCPDLASAQDGYFDYRLIFSHRHDLSQQFGETAPPPPPTGWVFFRNDQEYREHQKIAYGQSPATEAPWVWISRYGAQFLDYHVSAIYGFNPLIPGQTSPPLIAFEHLQSFRDHPNPELTTGKIDQVYEVYARQQAKRPIFSEEFIAFLKKEDRSLAEERLSYIVIEDQSALRDALDKAEDASPSPAKQDKAKDPLTKVLGAVSLFDGTKHPKFLDHALPVERKFPDLKLEGRNQGSGRVIEIRRFFSEGYSALDFARILAEHLAQVGKLDSILYVHTDRAGSRLFSSRRFGFQMIQRLAEDQYLLAVSAEEFFKKHVPMKFRLQHIRFRSKSLPPSLLVISCRDLMLAF